MLTCPALGQDHLSSLETTFAQHTRYFAELILTQSSEQGNLFEKGHVIKINF